MCARRTTASPRRRRSRVLLFAALLVLMVGVFFQMTRETRAAPGEYAVYRESTGTETITTTASNQAWDTTVSAASLFSIDGARTSVTLSEAGHYLMLYNLGVQITSGTARAETQGYLFLSNQQRAYGRASCHIRNSGGQNKCFMSGAAIINATTTTDTVRIVGQRTDSTSVTVQRIANVSGLTLLRLDDAWAYARIREVGGGQSFNSATWETLSFDTQDELDTGYSRSDGDVTLPAAGRYLVTSNVHFVTTTNNRNRLLATRLTLDGTEIAGTRSTAFMMGTDSAQDGVVTYVGIIETTAASQVLRLQGACLGEQCGQTSNAANGTALTIVQLPSTVETVRLGEAGGGQQVYATDDPITWDTNYQIDSAGFNHSTTSNTARVTVQAADDYLFLGTFYTDRTILTSTTIMDPHWEWRTNGSTKLQYGSFSHLNLGDQSNYGVHVGGTSGGAIFPSLSANDYIEVVNTNESTGTDTDPNFQANLMGLQGLRLSTLDVPDVVVSSLGTQTATSSIPDADFYVGGTFVFQASQSGVTETINSVTLTETGTVDAANDLSNVRLYFEYDTTTYDCSSVSYNGTETQFGATDTDAFSSANGTSTFSGTAIASTTQAVCMYAVVDVDSTANDGDKLDIEISSPATDVTIASGDVGPSGTVALSGDTTLQTDILTQIHYHWRLDNGSESGASSATGGEDTVLVDLPKLTRRRIRMEVSNEGSADSAATQYRLEYAQRQGTCVDTSSGWTDVGAVGGHWDMSDSLNLTQGVDQTSNIATTTGGVTDENETFVSTGVLDLTSQTGNVSATSGAFIELEYSIAATASALDAQSYCFRVTDAGTPLPSYQSFPEVSISADVIVSALGSHIVTVDASSTDVYTGGTFVIREQSSTRTVTDITITETGSVDASTNLNNIRLYYEIDSSGTPDCSTLSFDGTETQFGATDTDAFSSANGTSTFSGSVVISTVSTMCVYPVLDVGSNATNGETIDLEITNPGTQVIVSTGSVNPNNPVGPTASTTIVKSLLRQTHYHWRLDNGSESAAGSATSGNEDTTISNVQQVETQRVRIEVSNAGGTSSVPTNLTLEYAQKSGGSCAASSGWETVGVTGAHWVMSDSSFLTNGTDTTNISTTTGGVTDSNTTFLATNAAVLDTDATSTALTFASTTFAELEYAIEPTSDSLFATTYCFRVVGTGSSIAGYDSYPEATIRQNRDFFIQRGEATIPNGNTAVTIEAGTHYVAPATTSHAFIRITNTLSTGAGHSSGGGAQNAEDVTAYISNPENLQTSVNFTRIGSTNSTRIYWEIIEYTGATGGDNEIVVRNVQAYTTGNKVLSANIGVSGVSDGNDVVVFLTGQGNPQANATEYETALVTTDWSVATDEVVLERDAYSGGPGNPAYVSFAVVEFTGSNWLIQRAEHTYTAAGTPETESITTVNDASRAFIHAQHRTAQNTVADLGHLVTLSDASTVSFELNTNATTPGNHTSVAWVIENTQTNGTPMVVTRASGAQAASTTEPLLYSIAIGATVAATNNTSLFASLYSDGTDTSHPRAIAGAQLASTTHFELWLSDTGEAREYQAEVVEWPTAILTIRQNYYRFYVDNDALDPTDPWPPGGGDLGEITSITVNDAPPENGTVLRLRMSLAVSGANISQGTRQYNLEYGIRGGASCTAISTWYAVGDAASTTAVWRGFNATPADGTALSTNPPTGGDLNLSVSDRAGTYQESSPTPVNPYKIFIGDDVEYDWILEANNVSDLATYCFRMVPSEGGTLGEYLYYPTIAIAGFSIEQQEWQWYDDEDQITPSVALAASNTAPLDIANANPLKLRVAVEEQAGKDGQQVKLKLQYSEFSDFSVVSDVDDMDTCSSGSVWCYFDGAGNEGATITAKVLVTTDTCSGGVGAGCGTHNEYPYAPQAVGEVGTTTLDSTGSTVNLINSYTDPVFIVEAIAGDSTGGSGNRPAAAIITATTTSSFTARIQEPDDEADTHGSELVAYIVMERGAYQLPDGTRVDVDTKTTSNYYGNAVAGGSDDLCSFTQTFSSAPIVLTALQSDNNIGTPDFLTASQLSVTANDFACAMEVPDGESNAPGSSETIGWIAIEKGTFKNNTHVIEATSTTQSITGWTDTPWYEHLFSVDYFSTPPGVVASKQTRSGAEGGWVRYDSVGPGSALFGMDERDNGDRTHTAEVVAYLAFETGGTLYQMGTSNFTFTQSTLKEFEFTITHFDAIPNTTYFFRLYDVTNDQSVTASSTTGYPSLATEGASLSFSINGIGAGTSIEGVTTDATSTSTVVPFGTLSLGVPKNIAQRLTITTNAPNGYQVLAYEQQDLLSANGAQIDDITGSNSSPVAWSAGCTAPATGCYGYHVGDNTLSNGSTRFLVNDTYAPFDGTMREVSYSSVPVVNESTDIVYRVEADTGQEAGSYESGVIYIVVPSF